MINNALYDNEFLVQLHNQKQREIYARITLLTDKELPVEYIEGRVTGGSINVDGASALRRTCNLTLVLKDQSEINSFYWTFKSKFKLEIGLKNNINEKYPEIIWFPQGIFILTSCNMSQSTNNYSISINGKDKMCLLNGDLGGVIPHPVDFGVLEELDDDGNIIYTKLKLKNIIRYAITAFGGEMDENIIINDLDEDGLELLEYRGGEDMPLYLFRKGDDVCDGIIEQATLNPKHQVYINGKSVTIDAIDNYATVSSLKTNHFNNATSVKMIPDDKTEYNIVKITTGEKVGYRITDLVYAGDLKANVGETIVSVLDKISKMLSNFEYFYNLDGRFVFQKKHTYISTPWNGGTESNEEVVLKVMKDSVPLINLNNAQLTTSFANNPNILNVKNDFSVWGTYKSTSGADIPIHMRYALDKKPTHYTAVRQLSYNEKKPSLEYQYYKDNGWLDGENRITKTFTTDPTVHEGIVVDWRELIYQMALDYYKLNEREDFRFLIAEKNPHYPLGITGYEQYYTDIQGYWRQIYNPYPEAEYIEISANEATELWNNLQSKHLLYLESYYHKIDNSDIDKYELENLYVIQSIKITNGFKDTLYPFIGSKYCCLQKGQEYWYYDGTRYTKTDDKEILNKYNLSELYLESKIDGIDQKVKVIDYCFNNYKNSGHKFWVKKNGKIQFDAVDAEFRNVCFNNRVSGGSNTSLVGALVNWAISDNYGTLEDGSTSNDKNEPQYRETVDRIVYLKQLETGNYHHNDGIGECDNYWHTSVDTNPEFLYFWFDFLDLSESSELYKYSIPMIGARTKAVNDSNVKAIYYKDVPNILFTKDLPTSDNKKSGYTYIYLSDAYESLFTISAHGKSAKEAVDELLEKHSYATEQTTITTVPLYHLAPNMAISLRDEKSNVCGEYIITKFTVPLAYNGTMNLSTTKVVSTIL